VVLDELFSFCDGKNIAIVVNSGLGFEFSENDDASLFGFELCARFLVESVDENNIFKVKSYGGVGEVF
jgi:hypothetical protein